MLMQLQTAIHASILLFNVSYAQYTLPIREKVLKISCNRTITSSVKDRIPRLQGNECQTISSTYFALSYIFFYYGSLQGLPLILTIQHTVILASTWESTGTYYLNIWYLNNLAQYQKIKMILSVRIYIWVLILGAMGLEYLGCDGYLLLMGYYIYNRSISSGVFKLANCIYIIQYLHTSWKVHVSFTYPPFPTIITFTLKQYLSH